MTDRGNAGRSRTGWMAPALLLFSLSLLALGAAWLAGWSPWRVQDGSDAAARQAPSAGGPSRPAAAMVAASAPAPVAALVSQTAPAASAASAPTVLEPAHWHLSDTRVSGDERSPPLVRSPQPPDAAGWQLDDPSAYLAREAQEHRAVQQAFVEAADRELPAMRRLLDLAREQGLPAAEIAKGEEKLRRIAEQRDALRAELAARPPP